ncbi:hypothetical protein [Flavobacterium hydatis]|uniref:Uncharacterized protein n=1 Tax=Flavobacterium hydatis TaxID=991 RepID=A0A086AEX0_FLAHY|nr:hypothetical protein [Flavobacterium hydatis]KFF15234.1 hypothetical protein IW20_14850 [Flavobacterium hydatis]OXA93001.1 hypothetical protein B0A62_14295 [Flavobacterium hydatis]
MKIYNTIFLILILCCLISCNKNDRDQLLKSTTSVSDKIKDISESTIETITSVKDSITKTIGTPSKIKNNKTTTEKAIVLKDSIGIENFENEKLKGFTYFKKLLSTCKTGETLTQKELIENHNIPKEGVRLIKSITKTAEDEIDIKWNSTWFVEKISDAKFADARMKIKFEANKMYTSGKAIGIKYNKKIYNDLIIIGTSAYIPSVKGYHWKIGK